MVGGVGGHREVGEEGNPGRGPAAIFVRWLKAFGEEGGDETSSLGLGSPSETAQADGYEGPRCGYLL